MLSVVLRQNCSKCVNVGSSFSAAFASSPRPAKLFSLKIMTGKISAHQKEMRNNFPAGRSKFP